jgi:hypothetical protein
MRSLALCVGVLLACGGCNNSQTAAAPQPAPKVFSEADVTRAQERITNDYEIKGFEVEQVNLIKDSDRHLSGYVKLRKASGIRRPQLTMTCAATMDQDSGKSIYECR